MHEIQTYKSIENDFISVYSLSLDQKVNKCKTSYKKTKDLIKL